MNCLTQNVDLHFNLHFDEFDFLASKKVDDCHLTNIFKCKNASMIEAKGLSAIREAIKAKKCEQQHQNQLGKLKASG